LDVFSLFSLWLEVLLLLGGGGWLNPMGPNGVSFMSFFNDDGSRFSFWEGMLGHILTSNKNKDRISPICVSPKW
jgi:hypothetical protein